MFCKFCGRQIDRNTMQCVSCKKQVRSLEGGVGFWDLAGGNLPRESHYERPVDDVKMEKNIEQIIHRQEYLRKRITVLYAAVAGVLIVSLILNAILIGMVLNLREDYETVRSYVLSPFDDRNPHSELTDAEDGTTEAEPSEGTEPDTTDVIPSEPESSKMIIKDPTDEQLSEAIQLRSTLFRLHAKGEDLKFQWQKLNEESREWENVDTDLFDTAEEETPEYTESKLILKKNDDRIFGRFRCVVSNAQGDREESGEAVLSKKAE